MEKTMRTGELEVLSPAGNLDIFKAVISAGADAVYFGGELFGARAYADNFSAREGAEAIRYAHRYGKKAYLTVNTLLKNTETERKLYDYIRQYYEAGVDAVIVQDFGVFSFLREFFPELSIHASTQMTVCSGLGAKFLEDLGATRIVTARELSLEEIRLLHEGCGCEIETFVHGALCVCYSGQCLMSSLIGGRSGNRGRCAQPCRLPYQVLDESSRRMSLPGDYVLSPKDLCAIERIPELAEAGVYSLKIEGRMKQRAYAAGVVSIYRRYVDQYLEKGREGYHVSEKDRQTLLDLGNRSGFTDGYLAGHVGREMMSFAEGSHRKEQSEILETGTEIRRPIRGRFFAREGRPMRLTVSCDGITLERESSQCPERARNRATDEEVVAEKLKKTGDTPFVFADLVIDLEPGLFIPMTQVNELRRETLGALEETLLAGNRRAPEVFVPVEAEAGIEPEDPPRQTGSCLVVVETGEQFSSCIRQACVDEIAVRAELLTDEDKRPSDSFYLREAKKYGKRFLVVLPEIMRERAAGDLRSFSPLFDKGGADGVIACSYDGLQFLESIGYPREKVLLDPRIYTWNNRSLHAFRRLGYRRFGAPCELNAGELMHRENGDSYLTVYGRAALMITANCLEKNIAGCRKRQGLYRLRDRYQTFFTVKNYCRYCYNKIYNSRVLCLFSEAERIREMGFFGARLDFTLETGEECARILKDWTDALAGVPFREPEDATKGHWKRGVK